MKKIPVGHGKFALVDDEDFKELSLLAWHIDSYSHCKSEYASSTGPKKSHLKMHRIIMKAEKGKIVDHINGNGLDNRKENLRIATYAQNSYNSGRQKNNSSGFKGVSWENVRGSKNWRAQLTVNGKKVRIGRFKTPKEAALAHDKKAKELHGAFAYLNFPHLV